MGVRSPEGQEYDDGEGEGANGERVADGVNAVRVIVDSCNNINYDLFKYITRVAYAFITCDVVMLLRAEGKGLTVVVVRSLLPETVGSTQSRRIG